MNWRRFDTLGLRLFVLMWVTLVASHLLAWSTVMQVFAPAPPPDRHAPQLPTLPSLPPGGPLAGLQPGGPPAGHPPPGHPGGGPPTLPAHLLWLDYALRGAVIALGAALGARWLSLPMRRLARASRALSAGLARGRPPVLDEARGTSEVREAASVFNQMAARLQEQFDARGMHLAAVSHDLRTPLTRLRMRLEDAPPALARDANADIHEMSELIDATLEVLHEQREGAGAQTVDLNAMLQALADDLAASGHAVGLSAPEPVRALARPAALRRIVGNLVGNALRYGGSAQLTLARDAQGVLVCVDDCGPGIPETQLESAFRPWVRLTTAHARSGHGLGLAIARDLAERDGGRLSLANRPQGGLRAQLWLPAATARSVSAPTNSA
jgi:protein-histidine pros-kinase